MSDFKYSDPLIVRGQYYDQETGLHYNYFRDYDPSTGRYIESDPMGLAAGLNLYYYVGNNPTINTDRLGLSPDLTPCEYYDRVCDETGCRYYCFTAPLICKNAEKSPLFYDIPGEDLNCIRRCLVREDEIIRKNKYGLECPGGENCLSDVSIDAYHRRCFTECGVDRDKYPGVNPLNPWWNPIPLYNPNKQNPSI